jgi:hypothetical protein
MSEAMMASSTMSQRRIRVGLANYEMSLKKGIHVYLIVAHLSKVLAGAVGELDRQHLQKPPQHGAPEQHPQQRIDSNGTSLKVGLNIAWIDVCNRHEQSCSE